MNNETQDTTQPQAYDWHRAAAREIWGVKGYHTSIRDALEGTGDLKDHHPPTIERTAAIIARHAPPPDTMNANLEAALQEIHKWGMDASTNHVGSSTAVSQILGIAFAALAKLAVAEGRRNGQ
jgi:hypothetical protein